MAMAMVTATIMATITTKDITILIMNIIKNSGGFLNYLLHWL